MRPKPLQDLIDKCREQGIDVMSASRISTFQLCPRKYFYKYEMGLTPVVHNESVNHATPMNFGSALHAALATIYDGSAFIPSTCPCPFEPAIGCLHCKGEKIPKIIAQFLIHYPDDPIDEKDPRTRDRGIQIILTYIRKYRNEPFSVIAVEIPFAREFDDFTLVGIIDLLVEENGHPKPIDHKSTSKFGNTFMNQFKLSGQLTGYIDAIQEITGKPCTECDINAIRTTVKIDDDSFARLTTSRTPADISEWKQEMQFIYDNIKQLRATGFWPKNAPFACSAYYRECEFYPICTSQGSSREQIIKNGYDKADQDDLEDHD